MVDFVALLYSSRNFAMPIYWLKDQWFIAVTFLREFANMRCFSARFGIWWILTSIVNFWNTLASGLFQFSSIRSVLRLWKFSWKLEFVVSHEILDSLTCYYYSIWTLNKLLDFISFHFTHLILWLYCNFEGFDPMLFTNLVIGRSCFCYLFALWFKLCKMVTSFCYLQGYSEWFVLPCNIFSWNQFCWFVPLFCQACFQLFNGRRFWQRKWK